MKAKLVAANKVRREKQRVEKQGDKAAVTARRIKEKNEAALVKAGRQTKPQYRTRPDSKVPTARNDVVVDSRGGDNARSGLLAPLLLAPTSRSGRNINTTSRYK
jgi:hypothetical protein